MSFLKSLRVLSILNVIMMAIYTPSLTLAAALRPANAKNPQQCVQYFEINGQTYCTNQASAETPDLKGALGTEKNVVGFDGRHWRLGWWNQQSSQPMLEYVVGSETVDNWKELVTSQFFPDLQKRLTPEQFMTAMMEEMVKRGFQAKLHIIAKSQDSILYEWKIDNTPAENQHELQRIFVGPNGLHVLHYCSRPTMTEEHRAVWLKILSQVKVKA